MLVAVDIRCEVCWNTIQAVFRIENGKWVLQGYSRKYLKDAGWREGNYEDWRCYKCSQGDQDDDTI